MRRTLFTLACWLLLSPIAAQQDVSAAPSETLRPNILIILTDDMGYGDVAILNRASRIPTPNLDRLARESLIFTDAHSSGSYCVPSRYGIDRPVYVAHPAGIGRQLGQICWHSD